MPRSWPAPEWRLKKGFDWIHEGVNFSPTEHDYSALRRYKWAWKGFDFCCQLARDWIMNHQQSIQTHPPQRSNKSHGQNDNRLRAWWKKWHHAKFQYFANIIDWAHHSLLQPPPCGSLLSAAQRQGPGSATRRLRFAMKATILCVTHSECQKILSGPGKYHLENEDSIPGCIRKGKLEAPGFSATCWAWCWMASSSMLEDGKGSASWREE